MSNRERLIEVINSLNSNVVPIEQVQAFKVAAVSLVEERRYRSVDSALISVGFNMHATDYIRHLARRVYAELEQVPYAVARS